MANPDRDPEQDDIDRLLGTDLVAGETVASLGADGRALVARLLGTLSAAAGRPVTGREFTSALRRLRESGGGLDLDTPDGWQMLIDELGAHG